MFLAQSRAFVAPTLTPYARRFNGSSDSITTSIGNLAGLSYGTLAVLCRMGADATARPCVQLVNAAGNNVYSLGVRNNVDNLLVMNVDAGPSFFASAGLALTVAEDWAIIVMSKDTGTAITPTFYKFPIGGAWSTAPAAFSVGADPVRSVASARLGAYEAGAFLDGDIAVAAVFKNRVLDYVTEIQTLAVDLPAWAALMPDALWVLNQSAVSHPIVDVMGHGADQSAISGTTVISTGPALSGYSA